MSDELDKALATIARLGNRSAPVFKSLSEFTDAEIANEHHRRMMAKLGDQSVGVSVGVQQKSVGTGETK